MLAEVGILKQNSPRKAELHRTDHARNISNQRLGHQHVDMLRHHDKSDHAEPIPISHLLQNLKQKIAPLGSAQQRLPLAATPRNEVQCTGLVEAPQAPGMGPT